MDNLIDYIYPNAEDPADGSVILTTKNKTVDEINTKIQSRMNRVNGRKYYSADSIAENEDGALGVFPTEFLNSLVRSSPLSLNLDSKWLAPTYP